MHVEKLTLSEARAIISHDLRKNKTYSNKNIDTSKRNENIVFNKRGYDYIKDYIQRNGIKVHGANGKAKDSINYAVSVVLHFPEDCKIKEEEFFKMAHIIFAKKFGKDNIICSVVHRDEMRSHLHFVFMPIVKDKKHNKKKLCCKEVVSREMLQHLHDDVEKAFKDEFNIDVKLQNEEKGQFKNIAHIEDYKKYKDLQREVNNLDIQKEELQIDNIILSKQIDDIKNKLTELEKKFSDTENKNDDLTIINNQLLEDIERSKKEMNVLKIENEKIKTMLKDGKKNLEKCASTLIQAEELDKKALGYSPLTKYIDNLRDAYNSINFER